MGSIKTNRMQIHCSKSASSDAATRFFNLDESPMNGDFDTTGKICVTNALRSLYYKEGNRCDKPDSLCAPSGIAPNKTFCGVQQSSISDIQSLFDYGDMPPIANSTEFNISCSNCLSSSKSNTDLIDDHLEDLLSTLCVEHEIKSNTSINRSSFPVSTNVKSPSDDSCLADLLESDFCFKDLTVHKPNGNDTSDVYCSNQSLQSCKNEDEQTKSLSTLAEIYFTGKDVVEEASNFKQENLFSLISAENENIANHEVCSKDSLSLCSEDIEPSLSALATNYLSLKSENLNFPSFKIDPNKKIGNFALSSTDSLENVTIFDAQKKEETLENDFKFDFLLSCTRNKNIPTKVDKLEFFNNDLDQEETTKIRNISPSKRNRTESDEGYSSEKFSPEVNLSDCIKRHNSLSSDEPSNDDENINFSNFLSKTIQNQNKLKNTFNETPILNTALQKSCPAIFKLQPLNSNSKQSLFAKALSCKLKHNSHVTETLCKIKTKLFNKHFCDSKIDIDLPEQSTENISDKSSHCVVISSRLHYPLCPSKP